RRWSTAISIEQFKRATCRNDFPEFLKKDVDAKGILQVFGNGELIYRLRGVHARVTARWDFEPPRGAKDTHQAVFRGSRAQVAIEQGPEQHYQPALYVQQTDGQSSADFEQALRAALSKISQRFSGIDLKPAGSRWEVFIPEKYNVGHEAHFAEVTENFLKYLAAGKLPAWEVPNMLAKYYTTTEAFRVSHAAPHR
ncbi:MAG TPA: putative oxidoreductase C-terminal domain-containing protein, partial [Candidatus Dormibacteraeota bacterium]|nr:putative oxidoreductase C-terminal domain-containing protein [Candidatus Dormibacteraeota bacterium]